MATSSLFIIYRRASLRRLEVMFVLNKAAMGENTLPDLFGSYFRKWRQYVNCISRESGRRKRRGVSYGRHKKVGTGDDIRHIPCFFTIRPLGV
jgi:hypothetical protein